MFKHKDNRSQLNKQIRIGYLKIKQRLGEEETQEQAAEIWKLTSEEQQRLSEDNADQRLSKQFLEKLASLIHGWGDVLTETEMLWARDNILVRAAWYAQEERTNVKEFLDDITPVRLRIRKLTPRECFRLMDVSEEDIDKIEQSGVSRSQQYKMAGNSIVVNVLYEIFRTMFVDTEAEAGQQMVLF